MWDKGKCVSSEQTHTGAGLHSLVDFPGMEVGNVAAHNQCTESFGNPLGSFGLGLGETQGEIGKGGFPEQTHTGSCLSSVSRHFLVQRKLPITCFLHFWALLSSLDSPRSLCAALPCLGKEGNFRQNQMSTLRTCLQWVSR